MRKGRFFQLALLYPVLEFPGCFALLVYRRSGGRDLSDKWFRNKIGFTRPIGKCSDFYVSVFEYVCLCAIRIDQYRYLGFCIEHARLCAIRIDPGLCTPIIIDERLRTIRIDLIVW